MSIILDFMGGSTELDERMVRVFRAPSEHITLGAIFIPDELADIEANAKRLGVTLGDHIRAMVALSWSSSYAHGTDKGRR